MCCICLFCCTRVLAQETVSPVDYRMPANKDVTQVDILGNYYSQDGEFGAPQGGIGTEQLENIAGLVVVTVPLDSNSALGVSGGVDYYSSASTDRIDRQMSTASASDVRKYGSVTYTERQLGTGRTYRATIGTSQEYDVSSFNGSLGFSQEWDRGAQELTLSAGYYRDQWRLIYPTEFRRKGFGERGPLVDDVRQTFLASAVYSRIVNRRVQLALTAEFAALQGLLSTPFHRIYYVGNVNPELDADDIERLPDVRYKIPVSLRVNWKPNDALVVRSFVRYYADNWGIQGATLETELAYDVSEAWTVMPSGRVYTQQASRYYAGFAEHGGMEEFYTSDFDLASFQTYKVGMGVRFAPVFGVGRGVIANQVVTWREVSLRGAYYRRDPGLTAYTFTLGTSFDIRPRPTLKNTDL